MPTSSITKFRERLDLLCKKSGSRRAFAETAGIPYPSFAHYFSRSEPSMSSLEKMVRAGGVSADWLLMGGKSHIAANEKGENREFWNKISDTLIEQMKEYLPLEDFAAKSEVPLGRLQEIIKGDEPLSSELVQISEAMEISIDELLHPELLRTGRDQVYFLVPRFSYSRYLQAFDSPVNSPWSLRVSGNLAEQIGDPEFRKPFRYEWLRNKWPDQLKNLVYDEVDSNELEGFPKGSQVLVDLSDRGCWPGRYLVNWDGKRIFRRLNLIELDGSRISLVSHDIEVRQPEIRLDRQELAEKDVLIGKIVWGERE